jgi:hypothetical protein
MFERMALMAWNMQKPSDLAAEFSTVDRFRDYWFGECLRQYG